MNQAPSPIMQASNATESTAHAESCPSTESAPAMTSVGTAGIGNPTCSASTLTKISARPYCAMRGTSSCMGPRKYKAWLAAFVLGADQYTLAQVAAILD